MKMRLTMEQAKARDFIIDATVYPHVGYKGPRFAPTEDVEVFTALESALLIGLEDFSIIDIKKFIESL